MDSKSQENPLYLEILHAKWFAVVLALLGIGTVFGLFVFIITRSQPKSLDNTLAPSPSIDFSNQDGAVEGLSTLNTSTPETASPSATVTKPIDMSATPSATPTLTPSPSPVSSPTPSPTLTPSPSSTNLSSPTSTPSADLSPTPSPPTSTPTSTM